MQRASRVLLHEWVSLHCRFHPLKFFKFSDRNIGFPLQKNYLETHFPEFWDSFIFVKKTCLVAGPIHPPQGSCHVASFAGQHRGANGHKQSPTDKNNNKRSDKKGNMNRHKRAAGADSGSPLRKPGTDAPSHSNMDTEQAPDGSAIQMCGAPAPWQGSPLPTPKRPIVPHWPAGPRKGTP